MAEEIDWTPPTIRGVSASANPGTAMVMFSEALDKVSTEAVAGAIDWDDSGRQFKVDYGYALARKRRPPPATRSL